MTITRTALLSLNTAAKSWISIADASRPAAYDCRGFGAVCAQSIRLRIRASCKYDNRHVSRLSLIQTSYGTTQMLSASLNVSRSSHVIKITFYSTISSSLVVGNKKNQYANILTQNTHTHTHTHNRVVVRRTIGFNVPVNTLKFVLETSSLHWHQTQPIR